MPAFDIPGVGRVAMVTDPQGAPFYIMKPLPPEGDPNAKSDVFSADGVQRVGWNELSTSDPVAARRFYGDQFGWTSDDFMPMGEQGRISLPQAGGCHDRRCRRDDGRPAAALALLFPRPFNRPRQGSDRGRWRKDRRWPDGGADRRIAS